MEPKTDFQMMAKRKNIVLLTSVCLLFLFLLLPRMFSIMQFVMIDEVNWLHRSATFYDAVVRKDWEKTYVNPSPGVLTTWVGAMAFKIEAPYYRITHESMRTGYSMFETRLIMKGGDPLLVLRTARVIMVTLLVTVIMISYLYAQKIFGIFPSLIGFMIIALDPYIIALTRMNHLDAPVAVFMFLSLLTFIYYIWQGKNIFTLILSGVAGGFAFANKMTGLFFVPVIGILIMLYYFYGAPARKLGAMKSSATKNISRAFFSLFVWLITFSLAYVAIWPSMWVKPVSTISNMMSSMNNFAQTVDDVFEDENSEFKEDNNAFWGTWFSGDDLSRLIGNYSRYPKSFLWRTTPIVLIGLILGLYGLIKRKSIFQIDMVRFGAISLLMLAIFYTVFLSLPTKSGEKYFAPIYFVADLFAGLGWYAGAVLIQSTIKNELGGLFLAAILLGVVTIQSVWVFQNYPYYYTYYNPILGGLERRAANGFVGVGEGLDEMGRYLGARPNSSELKIMAWYGDGPFTYYFDGPVKSLYMYNSNWTSDFTRELEEMDYLITYINQKHRNQPPELFDILEDVAPVHTVYLNDVAYAWLYDVDDIPLLNVVQP